MCHEMLAIAIMMLVHNGFKEDFDTVIACRLRALAI